MMDENKISRELETQELCLAKRDELDEMRSQLQEQKGKLDVIESLQTLDSKYPTSMRTIIKTSAFSDAI